MTDYLLDTHALLWLSTDDEKLSDGARRAVLDAKSSLFVSVASVWEIAIKKSLGKLELTTSLESFLDGQRTALGFRLLPIQSRDALEVERLPFHHRDPVDRLLIAQAINRQLILLTRDPSLASYEVETYWG